MRPRLLCVVVAASLCLFPTVLSSQSSKPSAPRPITLDEFMNTTAITDAKISPDGSAVVIATENPDWKASVFRHDLWLWTKQDGLKPLTHSGSEERPEWSPDGKWIAFVSDREPGDEGADDDADPGNDQEKSERLWLIPVSGGEALPLYTEKLDVHAFAWSPDASALYYSVTEPLPPEQQEAQKEEWKDVIRWREQDRGDVLLKQEIAPALKRAVEVAPPKAASAAQTKPSEKKSPEKKAGETGAATSLPPGAQTIAKIAIGIAEIAPSPDGKSVAFETEPVHHRVENPADYEMFLLASAGGEPRQITHNDALESGLRWSADSRSICFLVQAAAGSLEGKYTDVQGRLYRVDPATGKVERLGGDFDGSFDQFTLLPDGREIATGLKGVETQLYLVQGEKATKLPGVPGSYDDVEASLKSNAIVMRQSDINKPTQVYMAADPEHPDQLSALTRFNPVFAERAPVEWEPYTWKSEDGRTIEGVLIFPPGEKEAKHAHVHTHPRGPGRRRRQPLRGRLV